MCKRIKRIVVVAGVGLLSVACGYDNGPETPAYTGAGTQYNMIPNANIDSGATMADITPGTGIGMFIEYAAGGNWTVIFSCDTLTNSQPGLTCPWSIDAQTLDGSAISGVDQQGLDSQDFIDHSTPSVLRYDGVTTTEIDQFTFQAAAGLPVGFDIIGLQGVPNPNGFVFWIGDGGLNKGVSSLSFNLIPNPAE